MLKKVKNPKKIIAAILTLLTALSATVVSYAVPLKFEETMANNEEKEEQHEDDIGFADVDTEMWYSDSIAFVTSNQIMSGFPEGTFEPDSYMTRGMFATILYNLSKNKSADVITTFSDIYEDEYYYKPVMWAYSRALVDGVTETEFAPDQNITREQLVSMLYRLARYNDYGNVDIETDTSFYDFSDCNEISSYAVTPIVWAKQNELIKGRPDGTFSPNEFITRAEAATIIERYMEKDFQF